jgi:UDP-N-acetylglucosamine transferase subunit ALG13
MIYVTVGTQLPFDRLIGLVDSWALSSNVDVLAQVGPSSVVYSNIKTVPFLSPAESKLAVQRADVIVAHAGMGSILSALELGKTIIIFPRRFEMGEHRNDHQMATARAFENHPLIKVAYSNEDLYKLLNEGDANHVGERLSPYAPDSFINSLREILNG